MLYVFYLSFTDLQLLNTPKLIGLDNYAKVFERQAVPDRRRQYAHLLRSW